MNMKPVNIPRLLPVLVWILLAPAGCRDFLDERPYKSQVVPQTLADLEALLDNNNLITIASPDILELLSDNYYVTDASYESATEDNRMNYIWHPEATASNVWSLLYKGPIYYANVVLDELPLMKIPPADRQRASETEGRALFCRAFYLFQAAQLYCLPYAAETAGEPGIPLRLTADISAKPSRSTVQQTYDRIIADLTVAAELLPDKSAIATHPVKAAAYGMLARTFLAMRDYASAGTYASMALDVFPDLMDYNDIPVSARPFPRFNTETIFYNNTTTLFGLLTSSRARIDSSLYDSYHNDDLRKVLYFQPNTGANAGSYRFRGSYDGELSPSRPFSGITTSEMYLIRAEAMARAGWITEAMADLNTLMRKRWKKDGDRVPFAAANSGQALRLILEERRKELVFRCLRWTDLRRLNEEGQGITLRRVIAGREYALPPHDPRWVLLLPHDVINRSDMQQNRR